MARKKENKPMTRQVRLYEDDAKLIDLILTTKDKKTTFADVIRPALRNYYRSIANRVDAVLDDIEDGIPVEDEHGSNSKKRNS